MTDGGKAREVALALDSAPETTPRDERLIDGRNPFAGALVANLSPRLAEELKMPVFHHRRGGSRCLARFARRPRRLRDG